MRCSCSTCGRLISPTGVAAFSRRSNMVASPFDDMTQGSASMTVPMTATRTSIVVRVPLKRAYQQWARIEDLPKFITPLRNVRRIGGCQFSYSWHANGDEYRGVLQILLQIPGRRIAWRALSNALMAGVAFLEPHSPHATRRTAEETSGSALPVRFSKIER